MDRIWIGLAGLFGAVAIGADAAAAHLLADDVRRLNLALTAGRYALPHAAVLLVLALLYRTGATRWLALSAWCFIGGIVCFCGGLFILAAGVATLGPVVPLGGVLFIAGWAALVIHALAPRAKN
jgi:uncharacterized membrane protein YgdD (TMEM256/DUF423 family)